LATQKFYKQKRVSSVYEEVNRNNFEDLSLLLCFGSASAHSINERMEFDDWFGDSERSCFCKYLYCWHVEHRTCRVGICANTSAM